ncbi:hypothetical protein ACFZAM_31970 [Streptomyces sp. NPDC008079]|uniref:hypothetical protein n=1 Tax=Streptomyces sp. NPDC008079 TaxID=3364806 RepID=UPI0036F175F8
MPDVRIPAAATGCEHWRREHRSDLCETARCARCQYLRNTVIDPTASVSPLVDTAAAQDALRAETAADIVGFLQEVGTPITGSRTDFDKGVMSAALAVAKRYGIQAPPPPVSAPGGIRCASAATGCTRSVRESLAADEGWEETEPGVWLDPQCAANAADRRDFLARLENPS